MDVTYQSGEGRFNFRVAALFFFENKLLVMKDEQSPYYYLPGGRVKLHETTEDAILREVREELELQVSVERLVWVVESFFVEDVSKEKFHELGFYYTIDFSKTDLLRRGKAFTLHEGGSHDLEFSWVDRKEIKNLYFYPAFLREHIFNLPGTTEHLVEFE